MRKSLKKNPKLFIKKRELIKTDKQTYTHWKGKNENFNFD